VRVPAAAACYGLLPPSAHSHLHQQTSGSAGVQPVLPADQQLLGSNCRHVSEAWQQLSRDSRVVMQGNYQMLGAGAGCKLGGLQVGTLEA